MYFYFIETGLLATKSRNEETILTADFNLRIQTVIARSSKSRSDETLLTAGFNLRIQTAITRSSKSCKDDTLLFVKVSSLRDLGVGVVALVRRLKPAVNKVTSLRD